MSRTIPRRFSITRDGHSYRGVYSLDADVVTVRYTAPDGGVREMSRPIDGLKAITVARAVLRDLA